jgi:hypothetical protein
MLHQSRGGRKRDGPREEDVALGRGLAQSFGLPMPVTSAVRETYDAAHAEGFGNLDMAGVIALYEKWAGVKVRGKAAAGQKA